MIVYHGTVESRARDVFTMKKVYVSPDYPFAEGYADSKAEDLNGTPVVVVINTNRRLYKDPEYEGTDYKSFFVRGPLSEVEVEKILRKEQGGMELDDR